MNKCKSLKFLIIIWDVFKAEAKLPPERTALTELFWCIAATSCSYQIIVYTVQMSIWRNCQISLDDSPTNFSLKFSNFDIWHRPALTNWSINISPQKKQLKINNKHSTNKEGAKMDITLKDHKPINEEGNFKTRPLSNCKGSMTCLLYTSDAADE